MDPTYVNVRHSPLKHPFSTNLADLHVDLHLNYEPDSPMKYLHRTLSSELDGKWQVVQETARAHIGPFDAPSPKIAFMYHLGFKRPKERQELEEDEVTGCFNWAPPNLANLESGIGSLLPSPSKKAYSQPISANKLAGGHVDSWYEANKASKLTDKIDVEWFVSGARDFIRSLAHSMNDKDVYSDYWQECSEKSAATMVRKLLSTRPVFPVSHPASPSLEADLQRLDLDFINETGPLTDAASAKSIQEAIFRLIRLGTPRLLSPVLDSPTRYFVCANASITPFEMVQHYSVVLLSLDRVIALTWRWPVPEYAFQDLDDTIAKVREYLEDDT